MAFLLIVPGKTIKGEMEFGLAMVWVHPHQPCLSSLDEVARKFTLLINLSDNWAYTFVWLSEDAQHVPLSNEGHLSAMVDGVPCRSACGHLCQLEVCRLIQCGDQVVYPKGLNGGLELLWTSLSGSLIWGMDVLGKPAHEPSFLLVDLSWVTQGDCMPKAPAPHRISTPPSPSHITMEHPTKTDSHISMTTEVQELLSWAMLDTSSQASGDSTPKRPTSVTLWAAPSTRVEDSSKPVATSLQASQQAAMPDDTMPISQTPEVASNPTALPTKTPSGADMGTLPDEVILLQGDMNRAMGHLLMTKVSMDTCCRKQVSDTKATFCKNEAEVTETIREAKAHCMAVIWEVEATCTTTMREAETACVDHAHTLQQAHRDSMQGLEREAIEEESSSVISCPTTLAAPMPSLGIKQWCHLPDWEASSPQSGDKVVGTSEEQPDQKWKNGMPLKKLLKGSWQEAFT